MTDKELWERLHENAEWARCNEWETPLCLADDLTAAADAIERLRNEAEGMRSNWSKSVITIKRLKSELTQEKIDNTNLIGELATVAAERDRYKAERDALIEVVRGDCAYCKYYSEYLLNSICMNCEKYACKEHVTGNYWELCELEGNT